MFNVRVMVELAVAIGALLGAYFYGSHVTNLEWSNKYNKDLADVNKKLVDSTQQQRDNDAKAAKAQADIEAYYVAKGQNEQNTANKLIADYRSGTVKLRKQLAAYKCAVSSVSDTSPGASVSNGAGSCGLSSGNVEFLIRFGAEANKVKAQLIAAQQVIANDRKLCGATQP